MLVLKFIHGVAYSYSFFFFSFFHLRCSIVRSLLNKYTKINYYILFLMYTLAGSDFFYCVFGCLTVCLGCLYIAEGKESIGFISYTILT